MSDFVLFKGRKGSGRFERQYTAEVARIEYEPGKATRISLANGKVGKGTCLGCADAPCITKDESELAMAASLDTFPGDPSLMVCPTKAIERDKTTGLIGVDASSCIGCGLCVVRCPYGAISLADSAVARVATDDSAGLTRQFTRDRPHPRPARFGMIGDLSGRAAAAIPETVKRLSDSDRNLFVRNLMHEVGMNVRVRRRGDTNMRIDAVGLTRSERPFVAEIELVGGELESPRALMEDVAILHARYGFAVVDIDAISIITAFPNVRSEYYQVIRDIEAVLRLRCRTLTVGALIALVWSFKSIEGFDGAAFAVAVDGIDLTKNLNIPGVAEPYAGAFRPAR
jgi:ferredoxin